MADREGLPLGRFEAGDPSFVDAIRRFHDADALAGFAATWLDDPRPEARRLLFEYLDRPLNAFRHEGLVKRLFKRAEAAGDDLLMARFLVLFDRSNRRARSLPGGLGAEETLVQPRGTTMPRDRMVAVPRRPGPSQTAGEPRPDWAARLKLDWAGELKRADVRDLPEALAGLEAFRLFSPATRAYLGRRAWRYFRKLGREHPGRYVAAACEALVLYRDEDTADGPALLDRRGLVHLLFHHHPAMEERAAGYVVRPGRSTAELEPAPIYRELWAQAPEAVAGLLATTRSTVVRHWAASLVEADPDRHCFALPPGDWLDLLGHADPRVAALAAERLDEAGGLEDVGVDRWVALVASTDDPDALESLCGSMARNVDASRATLAQAVALAGLKPLPAARLGFSWLQGREIGPGDLRGVLGLVGAACDAQRPAMLGWLRGVVAGSPGFEPSMVVAFLDSPHSDARREGWDWFRSDPRAGDDVESWRKLLESPHADVRLALLKELEARAGRPDDPTRIGRGLDPEALRQFWANLLLDPRMGSRARPLAVRQVVRRLETVPGEGPELFPLLVAALRSGRGPERRSGLAAIVRLIEALPEFEAMARSGVAELQIGEGAGKVPRA